MVAQPRKKLIVIIVVSAALLVNLVWLTWIVEHRQRPNPGTSDMSVPDITGDVPIQRGRIDGYIRAVQGESLEQSIENLSLHESLLVRAGLDEQQLLPWPHATERCLANRRLAKVFEAFSRLPEKERIQRSRLLFDKTFGEFSGAVDLILSRWEDGNPPKTTTELFGEKRSLDGYFWALCGAQLLCAQFCPAETALENYERIVDFHQNRLARVQQTPEKLSLPFTEVEEFLAPDLFQLNIARIVFGRHFNLRRLDALIPEGMVAEEARFYAWNAHTNEQDFTHQRRNVPADKDRVLHKFSFYRAWSGELRVQKEARRSLIDRCWKELREQARG